MGSIHEKKVKNLVLLSLNSKTRMNNQLDTDLEINNSKTLLHCVVIFLKMSSCYLNASKKGND